MKFDVNSMEFQKTWAKVVARSWMEPDFKGRLLEDPSAILAEYGVEVPQGTAVAVQAASGTALAEPAAGNPQPQPAAAAAAPEHFIQPQPQTKENKMAKENNTTEEQQQAGFKLGFPFTSALPPLPTFGGVAFALPAQPVAGVARYLGGDPFIGGSTLGSAGTVGSAGTICGATAGTVGSAGTAGTNGVAPVMALPVQGAAQCVGTSSNGFTVHGAAVVPVQGVTCVGSAGTTGTVGSVTGTAGTAGSVGTFGSSGS